LRTSTASSGIGVSRFAWVATLIDRVSTLTRGIDPEQPARHSAAHSTTGSRPANAPARRGTASRNELVTWLPPHTVRCTPALEPASRPFVSGSNLCASRRAALAPGVVYKYRHARCNQPLLQATRKKTCNPYCTRAESRRKAAE